jgi:hypothetical protein
MPTDEDREKRERRLTERRERTRANDAGTDRRWVAGDHRFAGRLMNPKASGPVGGVENRTDRL